MQSLVSEKAPKSFLVRAEHIPSIGLALEETLSSEWVSALLSQPNEKFAWQALKPTSVRLSLMPEADMIHLTGGGQFLLSCSCVRCMTDVLFQIPLELNLRLFASEKKPAGISHDIELFADDEPSESSVGDDDLAVSYYADGIIDVTLLMREQLFLDLPSYPSCDHIDAVQPKTCAFHQAQVEQAEQWAGGRLADLAKWRDRLPKN